MRTYVLYVTQTRFKLVPAWLQPIKPRWNQRRIGLSWFDPGPSLLRARFRTKETKVEKSLTWVEPGLMLVRAWLESASSPALTKFEPSSNQVQT